MSAERVEFIDVAKGVGILAVMVGHLSLVVSGKVVTHLTNACYAFHMPLFFIIAGFFLSSDAPIGEFAKKKFRRLIFPFLFGFIVVFVLRFVWMGWGEALLYAGTAVNMAGRYVPNGVLGEVMPIGAIWFFPALFISLLLASVTCRAPRFRGIVFAASALAVVWGDFELPYLPLCLMQGLIGTGYVMIGWWLYPRMLRCSMFGWRGVVMGVIFWCVEMSCGMKVVMSVGRGEFLAYLGSILITLVVLNASKGLTNVHRISAPLIFLGRNTLELLICHHIYIMGGGIEFMHRLGGRMRLRHLEASLLEAVGILLVPIMVITVVRCCARK